MFLISCEKIHTLWSELSLYVYRMNFERVGFNMSDIILGQLPLSFHDKVINFTILYIKQYLFCCIMSNKMPCLIGFLCHLKVKYNIERYGGKKTCK